LSFEGEQDAPGSAIKSREDAIEAAETYIDANYEEMKS
jgi:hypothetical protein